MLLFLKFLPILEYISHKDHSLAKDSIIRSWILPHCSTASGDM